MALACQHRQQQHSPFDGSPSPPPPPPPPSHTNNAQHPLTKRDVRRNRIMERLDGMIKGFNTNQHQHYRAQLQAVQVDMTLVLRAEPYENAPLEDGGEEIKSMVEGMMGAAGVGLGAAEDAAKTDYLAMAGKRYAEFVREVNDNLEKRDADLTALHNNYESAIAALERETGQKLHQAEEEHKALSNTIRQRLITSITKKRQHLLRDKEQLDIADSNALLLHPNHFSINNPGSPSGGQNRKTRHLRHRAASPSAGDLLGENGKRKRKVAAMLDEDGNESPVPGFRSLPPPDALGGGRSPFKDAREKNAYTQYEAPAYSLERIFTDKELALATATAQQATYRYFHQLQQQEQHQPQPNGTALSSIDGGVLPDAADADQEAGVHPTTESTPPPPAAAVEMERSTSHQVLTRGGARANPLAALSELATAAAASGPVRDNPFAPVIPTYHAVTRAEKSGAPAPPGVSALEVESDFEMMRRAADPDPEDPDESLNQASHSSSEDIMTGAGMRKHLLNQALNLSSITQPYRVPLLETGPASIGKGVDRPTWTGFAVPAQYEAQRAKQTFTNFGTPLGASGGAMAAALQGRIAAGVGGEAMSRTTSAGGVSEFGASEVVGRGRGRRGV